jgi:protein-S-isoprenylcysteine O-methyltransferase Ste14
MNATPSVDQPNEKSNISGLVLKWLVQIGRFTLIIAASLFISSGRLDWVMAWVYIGVFVAGQVVTGFILIPNNPELAAERAQLKGKRDLDRVLSGLVALFGPAGIWIMAGLDLRFGWSLKIRLVPQIAALAIVVLGTLLTIWAIASNKFFYGTLRIERDRGHAVAAGGPYQYVRHPGYVGGILADLATPLMLGSLWALIPAVLTVCVLVVRTALEDKTLQDELDGYQVYAQHVRYRLLPGVW